MRTLEVYRRADETGVSGTGKIAVGAVFPSGKVVIEWISDHPGMETFDSWEDWVAIHITPHPGNKTEVHWHDSKKRYLESDWIERF